MQMMRMPCLPCSSLNAEESCDEKVMNAMLVLAGMVLAALLLGLGCIAS